MLEQQKRLQSQWKQAMRNTQLEFMRELAEENMRFWQNTLNQPGQADDSEDTTQSEGDNRDTNDDNKPTS